MPSDLNGGSWRLLQKPDFGQAFRSVRSRTDLPCAACRSGLRHRRAADSLVRHARLTFARAVAVIDTFAACQRRRAVQLARWCRLIAAMKKDRIGRLQRATRRAFAYANGEAITTADILRHAFPRLTRFEPWRYQDARRAALRFAVRVGRSTGKGRPVVWRPTPELLARIKGN
jgi:hypothetical protein